MQNSKDVRRVDTCRGCGGHEFVDWLDLDKQPLANALVDSALLDKEKRYPLQVVYCIDCKLVQLKYIVDPDVLFADYVYFSSTSPVFRKHFENLAKQCFDEKLIGKDDLIVDIGSNDGIMLKPFKELGARVVGVEPASTVACKAIEDGIDTWPCYFNKDVGAEIGSERGYAKLVTMTNVFAHVDNLRNIILGVKELLDPVHGNFVIEVPYLGNMVKDGTFDLVYHEHLSYFSKSTIASTLAHYGMRVSRIDMIDVHGGSMRVYADFKPLPHNVTDEDINLHLTPAFTGFQEIVDEKRKQVVEQILKLKAQGKRIIGYGAPAKASTLLNYYRLSQYHIGYIIDDSPAKQEKLIPGVHIPIVDVMGDQNYVDYVFIFAWNFKDSIIKKLKDQGYKGKFIIPFPTLEII